MRKNYCKQKFVLSILLSISILSLVFSAVIDQVEATSGPPMNQVDSLNQQGNFPDGQTFKNKELLSENFQVIDKNRIETITLNMPQLDNKEKDIIVYLPENYETNEFSYPVIYLQGAQELFFHVGASNEEWFYNSDLIDFYTKDIEGDSIIVGIQAESYYNWDEYSPWVKDDMYKWMDPYDANRIEGGKGDAYLAFLIHTLKPEIDSRYRTLQDRENTAIGGYGMGGLISFYAGLTQSDVYSKVITLSPAIWFAEAGGSWLSRNRLLELIDKEGVPEDISFYIDVHAKDRTTNLIVRPAVEDIQGNKISFPQAYLQGTRASVAALLKGGLPNTRINGGIDKMNEWTTEISEPSVSSESDSNFYFLPIIYIPPTYSGSRFENFNVQIEVSSGDIRTRKIWVYLPPNYDNNTDEYYQVIYLTSAQHIFGDSADTHLEDWADWKFDEKLDMLYDKTGIGTIAVAVEFDADYPWSEYTPWNNRNMDNWNKYVEAVYGEGDAFLDFMVKKLKPAIDLRYRTLPNKDHTAIGGASRHALFAIYASLREPEVFSKVMAMSPAVWLAEGGSVRPLYYPLWLTTNQLSAWFNTYQAPTNVRYYLYVGTNESGAGGGYPFVLKSDGETKLEWKQAYTEGADKVEQKFKDDMVPYHYEVNLGGTHTPGVWSDYIEPALKYLGFY